MKRINKNNWQAIIEGANLFGTGGGGTLTGAENILQKISQPVQMISLNELQEDQLICTVFGVGGKQNCDPILASLIAIEKFQQVLQKEIAAIIPVENGPMAIANAFFIASELAIPVLDSDIVGMRSSPEVYLETISLSHLDRTPCVISDGKKTKTITEKLSLEKLEKVFRNFAIACGGDAIVAGYPLLVKDVITILPKKSITMAQKSGNLLTQLRQNQLSVQNFCKQSGWQLLGQGEIKGAQKDTTKGFAQGKYSITDKKRTFEVFFKNENLIVIENGKVLVTCPESITLLDTATWQALNNFNDNTKQRVVILAKKAIPIWRTKEGRNLFSPHNLGYSYQQVLLP